MSGVPDCIFLASFFLRPYSPKGAARPPAREAAADQSLLAPTEFQASVLAWQKPGDLAFQRGKVLCLPPWLRFLVSAAFETEQTQEL